MQLPSAPPDVLAVVKSPLAITCNWSVPSDTGLGPYVLPPRPLISYRLQFLTLASESPGPSPDFTAAASYLFGGSITSFSVTGLVKGYFYYFRVRSENSAGLSNWSIIVYERGVDLPDAVQAISANCVQPFTIKVTWSLPVDTGLGVNTTSRLFAVGGFLLEIALSAAFSVPAALYIGGNETSRTLSGLNKGQVYFYRITARNSAGP